MQVQLLLWAPTPAMTDRTILIVGPLVQWGTLDATVRVCGQAQPWSCGEVRRDSDAYQVLAGKLQVVPGWCPGRTFYSSVANANWYSCPH